MPTPANPWLPALLPLVVAALLAAGSVPVVRWLSFRVGAVAVPGSRRIHDRPTGRLGGISLCLGFSVAVAVFGRGVPNWGAIVGIGLAVTALLAIDDRLDLPYWTKLVLQLGCSLVVAVGFGVLITTVHLPGGEVRLGWLAVPVTVVWLMGMQNSINLLDGVDGLAAGVVAIVAGILLVAAVDRLAVDGNQSGVILLCAALIGACLGFLLFNFAPAKIFMGDSGSHFLGLMVGIITIVGVAKVTAGLALVVPVAALGLPITDTAFAIVRRQRAGRSFAEADTRHLHHRLLARGLSPRETAVTFYLVTAILGCVGLAIFGHRVILATAMVLLALSLGLLGWRVWRRRPAAAAPTPAPGPAPAPSRASELRDRPQGGGR